MEFVDRENEVLKIIEVLSKSAIDFILVGGYAVSSLAKHRFSVDCDLVVRNSDLKHLDAVLTREGFSEEEQQTGFDKEYGGKFIRYTKKIANLPVSVDLLVDSLASRETDASWSYDYVSSNSLGSNIAGIQVSVKSRVCNKDLLIAFKLHSARKPDLRDVIVLGEDANWSEVVKHIRRGNPEKLRVSLGRILEYLEDKRLIDSLKGDFSLREDVTPRISKTKREVEKILSILRTS